MQPPRRPHLEWHAVAGARDDAEEPELTFAPADQLAQGGAARLLAAALGDRQPQLRTGAPEPDAAVLHGDERHLALATQLARDRFAFDGVERRLYAGQRIGTSAWPQPKCVFQLGAEAAGRRATPGPGPHRQLTEVGGELGASRRDDVSDDFGKGQGE